MDLINEAIRDVEWGSITLVSKHRSSDTILVLVPALFNEPWEIWI